MKQIIRITVGLVISCLVAGAVMGGVFTVTDKAKKRNEHLAVQETMLGLLGYKDAKQVPADLKLYSIYRYIITDGSGSQYLGYLVPVAEGNETGYVLLKLDLQGKFISKKNIDISPEKAREAPERESALKAVLKPPISFRYADEAIVATLGKKRLAYLLPGEFLGFKTTIKAMLALDPSFGIVGLDILEHEEDPGLGGEIEQEYFKNQFKDKSYDRITKLKVIKEPLPDEYKKYLEKSKWKKGAFSKEQIATIRKKYEDKDIYAITGATISSKAVTDGVKGMIRKFAYRMGKLEAVIVNEKIPAVFL
ncbi:MAG: FMN-binding protein [Deltaproteobacteria bacterium]|nr:FMN-binding protein [Deltaproteobacteria bacterium]